MKRLLALFCLFLLCLHLVGCASSTDEARNTPEGTVKAFVEAVARGDVDAANGYFVREELLSGFRPELLSTQYGTNMRAEQLVELFDADLFGYMAALPYYTGALDESVISINAPYIELCKNLAGTYAYESLQILDTGIPLAAMQQDYYNMYAARAAIYGADDVTERVALTEYAGKTYLTGYVLIRYGKQWGIFGLTSPAADMIGSPPIVPITQRDYLRFFQE